MNINSSKNCILLFGALIIASAIRGIFDTHPNITNIVAAINIMSFWFVVYLILEEAENKFLQRLKDNKIIGEQIKIKKKKHFKFVLKWTRIIIFVLGLLYIFVFADGIINDIIGLASLFLSIETDYISNYIQDKFYKKK